VVFLTIYICATLVYMNSPKHNSSLREIVSTAVYVVLTPCKFFSYFYILYPNLAVVCNT